jgi:hypothetical protein
MGKYKDFLSSNPDGRFEVRGFHAVGIAINVEAPAGYRTTAESRRHIRFADSLEKIRLSEGYKKLPPEAKVFFDSPVIIGMAGLEEGLPTHKADKEKPTTLRLEKL